MNLLIFISIFISIFLVTIIILKILYKNRLFIEQRLDNIANTNKKVENEDLETSFYTRAIKPIYEQIFKLISKRTPELLKKKIETKLQQAGNPYGLDVEKWFIIKFIGVVIFPTIMILLLISSHKINMKNTLLITICTIIINIMPNLYIIKTIQKRKNDIIKDLSELLDLITVSVEAGLSFDGALSKIVYKVSSQLSNEFQRVLNEMMMGKSRREALRDMATRNDVPELTMLIGAIIQAEELGVGISSVLKVQSKTIREKRKQKAEEKAMQAPVKMLFPLIFFIFPSIFVVLLGPALLKIIETLKQ